MYQETVRRQHSTLARFIIYIALQTLLLCLALPQARAQVIYSTGFEGFTNANWQGWSSDNGIWQIGTPPSTSGPKAAYDGSECAGTAMTLGSYPAGETSRLISPVITLPSVGSNQRITLSFAQWFVWDYAYDAYYSYEVPGTGDVQVTTNAGASWTTVSNPIGGSNKPYNLTSGGWSMASVDLSAYAGQQVQIGFQHKGGTYSYAGWYLDDVTVAVPATPFLPLNQTTGFENFTLSNWQGWSADNGVWLVGAPTATSGPGSAYDGKQCVGTSMVTGAYPLLTSSRLITPPISLPSLVTGQKIMMTFWQWFNWYPGGWGPADTGAVQVSTWTNGAWSTWTTGPTYNLNSGGWTFVGRNYAAVNLTAYAGQIIQVGFQHNGGPDDDFDYDPYPGWYIDDVTVVLPAPEIASITPMQGALGASVTLTGNFFDGATAVEFNGAPAAFSVISDTEIATSVPTGATTGTISVTTPGGTADFAQPFLVLPTANPQTVSVAHNTAKAITLTGSDPDNLTLTFAIASPPANGALSGLNPSTGAVTYTPNTGFQGADNFTFTANNGTATSAPATVTLNVAPGIPTANAQTVSVAHNSAVAITLTGTDPDVPPLALTFAIAAPPANGTLSGLNATTGAVTYTPNSNFGGTDSFTFTVNNGTNTSAAAVVTLKVTPGTPIANAQTVSVVLGKSTPITLTGTDPDSPPLQLTFAIARQPSNGTLSGFNSSTGAVTYTPNSNFQGTDSFTFTVNNGTNTSTPATVTLNVAPGTPTANPQSVSVAHSTATAITLTGTDPDSPPLPLKFAIASSPTNGTLGGINTTTGVVTYTPNANFQGTDSFTFTVNNGTNTSAPATVTLAVAPGTPVANPQTVSVAHNTATAITLTGTDADNPPLPLQFAIATQPINGTLGTLNTTTGAVTYTPNASFHGTDTFTFTVSNGTNTSAPATVTLNVAAGTPTANPQTVSVAHNTATALTLTGSDSDNPPLPLTFAISSSPAHGSLGTLNATTGAVTYTPNPNFHGTDSFTFTVSNGTNTSAPATVTLTVAVGTPIANPQTVSVAHNTAKSITLTGSDPDNPLIMLTFAIAKAPAHGTLGALNKLTGVVTYTPSANYHGTDSFAFTVSNGTNTSAAATVTLNVAAGTPTANPQTVAVAHNTAAKITLTGSDSDSPALPLTFTIKTEPAHGTLSGLNTTTGAVTYTPGANKYGADSFTFTVSNGTNTSAPATVTLNVAPGVPTANAQTVNVTENKPITITLTGSDPDNPPLPLTFAIASSPTHGSLGALNTTTGKVTYTPDANYHGADSFTFTVSNGTNKSAAAKVTLNVSGGG